MLTERLCYESSTDHVAMESSPKLTKDFDALRPAKDLYHGNGKRIRFGSISESSPKAPLLPLASLLPKVAAMQSKMSLF